MVYRQSKQRSMVYDFLSNVDKHVSAEEIYGGLKRQAKCISLASVYRNLNILEDMHEIRKIVHPMIGSLYDKTLEPHDHLYCERCHQLFDVQIPYDVVIDQTVAKQHNVQIRNHEMLFYGVCELCNKALKH